MSKVLSIELGYSLVRVLEIDYKAKKPKIYANFEFKTPENVLEDGFIKQPEELGNALRAELESHGLKTKDTVFTISSARIASRDTTLPYVKENKLADLVMASAPDVFPVDISNCKITYQILETQDSGDGNKKYHVALYAAPNDLLESYYTLCTIAGLKIVALDYSSNSFAVATQGVFASGTFMAVKVDDRSSLVSIFSEGKIAIQRTIPYGGDSAIEEIINLEEQESGDRVSYEKALGLLQMRSCIRASIDPDSHDDEDGNDDRIKQFRMSVAETFTMFNSSIMRVIDYYNSRNSDSPVESVYITGYAESFLGLPQLMSNELGVAVDRLGDRSSDIFSGLKEGGAYINCIGAAIEPMDFIPDKHNDKKRRSLRKGGAGAARIKKEGSAAVEPNFLLIGILVFVVCLIGAGALAAFTLIPYTAADKKNKELTRREAELSPIQDVYFEQVRSEMYLEQAKQLYFSTQTQNDNIVKFLGELENVVPSSIHVMTFTSDKASLAMTLNVDSKEEATVLINEMRKFESLAEINVSSISEETDDLGSRTVKFSITGVYAPMVMEEDTPDTQEADSDTGASESTDTEEASDNNESTESTETAENAANNENTDDTENTGESNNQVESENQEVAE